MIGEDVSLRPALEEDLPRLSEIEAGWPTPPRWTPEHFRKEIASDRSVGVVAERAGEIVGFGFVWLVAGEAQIADLVVDPALARRGIGRLVLRRLLAEARRRGCTEATLEVSADNPSAKALYDAEGFLIVGRRSKIYNGTSDALLMTKRF
jgi:ribosomal-protein-alanine N-acetyltransferase